MRLLSTVDGVGWVADTWEALDADPAVSWQRVGVVFTVRPWAEQAAQPFLDWGVNFGYSVVDVPADTAARRFEVAIGDGRRRAEERMTGGSFGQVWPPPGAPSLVASVTAGDTRDGWLRVTWLPDGAVTVQGAGEHMRDVPLDRSWGSLTAWAYRAGVFATISEQNSPQQVR